MNCNTTHYRANSSSVPGDPTSLWIARDDGGEPRPLSDFAEHVNAQSRPTWSPDGQRIAYVARHPDAPVNEWTLYVRHVSGTVGVPILRHEWIADPVWAPDGERIAVVRGQSATASRLQLFLTDAGGASLRMLTTLNGQPPRRPAWSPDGTRLVFGVGHDLWVLPVDGGPARRLTDNFERSAGSPAWRPRE